jgi:hypothetical protein
MPACAPSSITDEYQSGGQTPIQEIYPEESVACPVAIVDFHGYENSDSSIKVSYTLRNLTDSPIEAVTVRTYVTTRYIFENVWEVAREAKHSDTTFRTGNFTKINDRRLDYMINGIKSSAGKNFFFEILNVTFRSDSVVEGYNWFQYETVTVGGERGLR